MVGELKGKTKECKDACWNESKCFDFLLRKNIFVFKTVAIKWNDNKIIEWTFTSPDPPRSHSGYCSSYLCRWPLKAADKPTDCVGVCRCGLWYSVLVKLVKKKRKTLCLPPHSEVSLFQGSVQNGAMFTKLCISPNKMKKMWRLSNNSRPSFCQTYGCVLEFLLEPNACWVKI